MNQHNNNNNNNNCDIIYNVNNKTKNKITDTNLFY